MTQQLRVSYLTQEPTQNLKWTLYLILGGGETI